MRVIAPQPRGAAVTRPASRIAHLELLGLLAATVVVVLGLTLAYLGKADAAAHDSGVLAGVPINLQQLHGPDDLMPLLGMFESRFERRAAAVAIYRRTALHDVPLEHVGGLARVAIPATEILADRRYVQLRSRLERRPAIQSVPVLSPADLADLKPHVVVRTPETFRLRLVSAALCLVAAFWTAHAFRRRRGTIGDPVALPVVLLLCGIGLMNLVALRDPLRDTMSFSASVSGIVAGLGLLVVASEVDLEASALRRAVLGPLAVAVVLAALLLLFGTGPGTSGARLRLLGFQPADFIRLLVVLALAAHFARRGDFLREYSQEPTPSRPWLRHVNVPRWKDIGPAIVSLAIVVAFFFLQRDLGPALVLSCVFLGMYGVARHRGVLVAGGLGLVLCAFGAAYWTGIPATVRQRVAIWVNPWSNGVPGGNQIAHGLWALATGSAWGSGLGRGNGGVVPAGDTDFIMTVAGEELGFVGMAVLVALYAVLCWRCVRTAVRAPGDYTALLALGIALTFVVQACVIASGVLGLLPLSGVVTPFLSYGRSAMLANFLALGIALAIARRQGPVRPHLHAAVRVVCGVLAIAGAAVLARAGWVQLVAADAVAGAASLTEQSDGGYRFEYNPRLLTAARLIERGSIYDRRGLPLASSKPDEIAGVVAVYRIAGLTASPCSPGARCYPLGASAFHVLGDWTTQANWGASNSSYVERDSDIRLKGFDDRPQVVEVVNPRTGVRTRTTLRDYTEVLPLARDSFRRKPPAVRALLARGRDLHLSLEPACRPARPRFCGSVWTQRGPRGRPRWCSTSQAEASSRRSATRTRRSGWKVGRRQRTLMLGCASRPGAIRAVSARVHFQDARRRSRDAHTAIPERRTFACIRLPDGRVGNYVRGWTRPVRDDPMDRMPHGMVDLGRGLVVSCNAYFAQLAVALGPKPVLEAASLFGIEAARPHTEARLRRTIAHAGYGQGEVLVSPLRMARVAAAVAHDGSVVPIRWSADGTGAD